MLDPTNEEVTVHNTTWKLGKHTKVDQFTDIKYKPKLYADNVCNMNELEMWLLFFPFEDTDNILDACNAKVDPGTKQISKSEFFKVIGFLYAMSTNILHTRREYWSTKNENQVFPSPSFGKRFGMGYHRFEFILNNLAFSTEDENDDR